MKSPSSPGLSSKRPPCSSSTSPPPPPADAQACFRHRLLGLLAHRLRAAPAGGNNPEYGLDCSGLINYVFKNGAGIKLPRTSKELATKGKKVETPDMGDLVFFSDRSDKTPTHVGLYIGENRFVHAPRTGDYIKVSKLNNVYYKKHYLYAVRLIT